MKTTLKIGDTVKCINDQKFRDKEVGPPLELNKTYNVVDIITTVGGHDHIDVGLKSKYNYISCQTTGIQIPRGDSIHWCHPSRFEKI